MRQSTWLILVELIVVARIFVADARKLIPLSKTPFLTAFSWLSLRVRKIRWSDIGLSHYRELAGHSRSGVGLLFEAFQLFISQPGLVRVLGKQPDLELFRALH